MESMVKVPSIAGDMDFLAFSFNNKHSWDDFNIIRTSDGNRYNDNLVPTMQDKTAEVPGGDGMYYFGTTHKSREFNINIAFDNMSEVKYREMRQWLNGKEMGDLWFSEAPYKVYTVKPTGSPSLKTLCFDNEQYIIIDKDELPIGFKWEVKTETKATALRYTITYTHTIEYPSKYTYTKVLPDKKAQINDSIKDNLLTIKEIYTYSISQPQPPSNIRVEFKFVERVYKGEGTIQFTAYYPYAHTPDYVVLSTNSDSSIAPENLKNGKVASSYSSFVNKEQWLEASGIHESDVFGANWGDIPAHFILCAPSDMSEYNQKETLKFKVGNLEIAIRHKSSEKNEDGVITYTHYESIEWDSKTGMVTAMVLPTAEAAEKKRMPISYTGDSLGAIPAQSTVSWGMAGDNDTTYSNSNLTLNYHYWYY